VDAATNHGGQKYETCCDTGTLAMCQMSALVLWRRPLSLVLAPPVNLPVSPPVSQQFVILTDSSFLSYRQSQLFVSKRAFVDASSPA